MKKNEIDITQDDAQGMIKNCKGSQFFTVEFVKRIDGSTRIMNCRKGVQKGLKGGALSFNPTDHKLVGVYDIPKGGHRFISLDEIKRVSMGGKRYIVKN